jgi:hypothetical protein
MGVKRPKRWVITQDTQINSVTYRAMFWITIAPYAAQVGLHWCGAACVTVHGKCQCVPAATAMPPRAPTPSSFHHAESAWRMLTPAIWIPSIPLFICAATCSRQLSTKPPLCGNANVGLRRKSPRKSACHCCSAASCWKLQPATHTQIHGGRRSAGATTPAIIYE